MSTAPVNGGMHQPPAAHQQAPGQPEPQDKAMSDDENFRQLDDPEFLALRRRVREELERTPGHGPGAELTARYEALNDEFLRRATAAWAQAN
jgi:hypothetical protein